MIKFTGKEFKQFWEDDEYWQYGSLAPDTMSIKINGANVQEEDIDDAARSLDDQDEIEVWYGIVTNLETKEQHSSFETFCFEWLERFKSVKYTLSFKQNSVLEKFLEFCFKSHDIKFKKEYGDSKGENTGDI